MKQLVYFLDLFDKFVVIRGHQPAISPVDLQETGYFARYNNNYLPVYTAIQRFSHMEKMSSLLRLYYPEALSERAGSERGKKYFATTEKYRERQRTYSQKINRAFNDCESWMKEGQVLFCLITEMLFIVAQIRR
jgi:hypothetical protein